MTLVVNKNFAQTLELSEINILTSRLTAMKQLKDNPMGVEVQTFGNATAFSVKSIPGPSFNTVKGLTTDDEKEIERIIDYYKQKDIPARFELTPAHTSPELLSKINDLGFYQSDFHTTLYMELNNELMTNDASDDSKILIRPFEKDEFDTFAEIYTKGFQMPSFTKAGVAQNNEILFDNENWHFYLATVQGEPAGICVLHIQNKVATLAASATVPHLRNKGVHTALIKYRVNKAISEECNLVVAQAKFGSVSQNNMERLGLRIAYTKAIWI